MTAIRLDAASAEKVRTAEGAIVLCDENGKPIRLCTLKKVPMAEPDLTPEEWERRAREPGGMTTAQMLEFLSNLGKQ